MPVVWGARAAGRPVGQPGGVSQPVEGGRSSTGRGVGGDPGLARLPAVGDDVPDSEPKEGNGVLEMKAVQDRRWLPGTVPPAPSSWGPLTMVGKANPRFLPLLCSRDGTWDS